MVLTALSQLKHSTEPKALKHFRSIRLTEEEVGDCVGDGETRCAFEPKEFTRGIELEKNVPVIGRKNDVDGAVVQGEVIHEAQNFFFDVLGQLVVPPVLEHPNTIAAPVVGRARGDL